MKRHAVPVSVLLFAVGVRGAGGARWAGAQHLTPSEHQFAFRLCASARTSGPSHRPLPRRGEGARRAGEGQITFTRQIAPIIFRYCSSCHRPGESAPFALLTYEDVHKHAAQIVSVTQSRYMPPWLPEPGYGDFAGGGRLTESQVQAITAWVKQGCPEGDPADSRPVPQFTDKWQLGPPDLIVRVPKAYRLAAGGTDVFRNFVLPIDLRTTRYVRAVEMRPGNKRIVHHANILIDHRRFMRKRDGEDGQPGFPGILSSAEALSDAFDPDSHFLFWKPGSVLHPEPEDMSWRLDPGTDLVLNMHLRPSGKEESIQPEVGFYFSSQPPRRRPMLIQLEHDGALDIEPGAKDFAVEDHLALPLDAEVLAVYPHAHYLGRRVEAWAMLPDGTRRWLLEIPDWDINWQAVYTYREPVLLPKGALIAMRITYDNSAANPRNPSHPPQRVRAGPRSQDEMGHVWFQVLPRWESNEDPRIVLQEALMRRRLEKYPGDFAAHCNLGQIQVTRKRYDEAVSNFQQALRTNPSSATALSGLGAAYLAEGRIDDAIREFKETLRIDPEHVNAHLNLARALGSRGDLNVAAAELGTVLKQKPDDVDARVGLGFVYLKQGRYQEALPEFQEAARLRPEDADIQTNLGILLARQGDLPGAIKAFEQALNVNPDHETARQFLERARAAQRSR